jgi:excisionase family DNA binding protein
LWSNTQKCLFPEKAFAVALSESRSYTTVEVAKRLGVSLQTVQRWVDAGHLKAWKTLGGHRRIDAESAEKLFKTHEERMGAPAAEAPDTAVPPAAATPLTVLLVDDKVMDRELLTWLVRKALPDARVETAENGFQALVIMGRIEPQIVITDINMPHMNGLEMIRQVLANETWRPRTLVAVSALSKQGLAEMGTLPSEVRFVNKPLDEAKLMAALKDHV